MSCDCNFDNTGQTHEYNSPMHPNRSAVRVVKVDYIEQLKAELKETKEAFVDLTKLLAKTVDKCPWIPVSEPPKDANRVWVCSLGIKTTGCDRYNIVKSEWMGGNFLGCTYTHWMPIIYPKVKK